MGEGFTVLQVAALLVALAVIIGGLAWFLARWRAHDERGRPRPPSGGAA